MIEAKNIRYTVPRLDSIDIKLKPNRLTGIIGPNGAGKTTLLKMLTGLLAPETGSILLDGKPLYSLKTSDRARNIAYLEQYSFVHWPLSVLQLIKLGRFPHRNNSENSPANDQRVIDEIVQQVGVKKLLDRSFNSLSGGERARVLLARALAVRANHLLVDEPIASLDLKYQLEIMQLLAAQTDVCVCVILHDLNLAAAYCDTLYLLDQGKVVSYGAPQKVLTEEMIAKTFNINARVAVDNNRLEIYPLG